MFDMFVDAIRDVAGHLPSPRHLPLNTCPCENNHRRQFPSRLLTEYRVDAGKMCAAVGEGDNCRAFRSILTAESRQRISASPIAFQTDATTMETASALPWQRHQPASRNLDTDHHVSFPVVQDL